MRTGLLLPVAIVIAAASALAGGAPENLALKARVSATSEHSAPYRAAFVADGIIPKVALKDGGGKEWAVNGGTHAGGADLTMEWAEPVTIGEVVYYGRTSYAVECWKACEVYLDDSEVPAAKAAFKTGHGPQRVTLAAPARATKLVLKFRGSHACPNPGAAEIRVYAGAAPDSVLGKFVPMKPMHGSFPGGGGRGAPAVSPVEESPELAADLHAGKLGFSRMLLVQRHEFKISHVYTYHVESFRPGGGIHTFEPGADGGKLEKVLDAGTGEIMDCTLSYDAKEVLFSWKRKGARGLNHMITDRDAKFQVYRMGLADREPRLVTDHYSNNFNPCWLPDGGIAFLSDRKLSFAYCFTSSSPLLYRMDGDGANVRKISHGYLNDFTPSILNDGRIIYSRWEYVDRPAIPIQSLWTMKPDGTKVEGFFGNRVLEPGTFMEARSIGKTRKVLCVLTGHNGSCRGALGVIDPVYGANAQEGIRNITPEIRMGHARREGPVSARREFARGRRAEPVREVDIVHQRRRAEHPDDRAAHVGRLREQARGHDPRRAPGRRGQEALHDGRGVRPPDDGVDGPERSLLQGLEDEPPEHPGQPDDAPARPRQGARGRAQAPLRRVPQEGPEEILHADHEH